MKFTHGAWQTAPGVTPVPMRRVYRHRTEGNTLWVALLDRQGTGGDRFEGTVIQLRISSPMPNVIRVCANHHNAPPQPAGFDLDYGQSAQNVKVEDSEACLEFTSGGLTLRIEKATAAISFLRGEELITRGGNDGIAYVKTASGTPRMAQRLSLGVGECIYGLGERFGPLVKNGQTVTISNEDGGTTSDLAYKNIPFYLSTKGYGLLVNSPGKVEFEVATERVMQVQFSLPGEQLDYYVFHGPDPKDVLDRYTALSGRPAIPPAWSFGLWLSTSFTTQYDEKTINAFVDGMAQRSIPLSVFHFDCFWMKERQWCDFEWDKDAFADPVGMLKRLKSKGLKVCLWINSYISQLSKLYDEGSKNNYFLRNRDGSVYQRDAWQPGMALVDFTNPAAVKWYTGKLRALLEMGVDCFKTDFGEFIPEEVVYHDGSDPKLMHNYYAYLYNKAVFELLEDYHGKGNAMVFARSASGGSQKFPVHWGGDCEATWESMLEDLRGGLSFCMSGPAFWSHDIGGFAGKANPSLYKRWAAFGLLSSHSRLHGSESYRVPWLFDEESVDVMRHFSKLKNTLFPYLFAAAHDAGARGWPMMRAMWLEFPGDRSTLHLEQQYMLGSSLLVAPIFRQDNVAEYYLPAGRWTDLQTSQVIEGGRWCSETMDFFRLPLMVRENTLLPISSDDRRPQWQRDEELTLHLFQIQDGADFTACAWPASGERPATFHVSRNGEQITITPQGGATNLCVMLRSTRSVGHITNGQLLETTSQGALIDWNSPSRPIVIETRD